MENSEILNSFKKEFLVVSDVDSKAVDQPSFCRLTVDFRFVQ